MNETAIDLRVCNFARTIAARAIVAAVVGAAPAAFGQGFLVAVDADRNLYDVSQWNGEVNLSGALPALVGTPAALTYVPIPYNESTYISSSSLGAAFKSYTNWFGDATALVGPYADTTIDVQGIEWDPDTNRLFGMSNGELYLIDATTGAGVLIGSTGIAEESNLVYDSTHDAWYMTSSGTDSLYSLDVKTATATLIGPLNGPTNPRALALSPGDDAIYLLCSGTQALYTVHRVTGAATLVGNTGPSELVGLVWTPVETCAPGGVWCDYNDDGGLDGGDVGAFFADYESGAPCADVYGDGGITCADCALFFDIFERCDF